jgi:hypothetical protein
MNENANEQMEETTVNREGQQSWMKMFGFVSKELNRNFFLSILTLFIVTIVILFGLYSHSENKRIAENKQHEVDKREIIIRYTNLLQNQSAEFNTKLVQKQDRCDSTIFKTIEFYRGELKALNERFLKK